jgi:Polyketide cyclase / dehydrase and lipid transport
MMWTGTWPRVSGTRGAVFMPERHIRVQRRMAASTDSVWALFADFPNLASHWSGLRATRAIGDQTGGVGARRRVELKPIGSNETVTIWEEGRRIDTQNLPSASVPFKHAESTLTLEPDAEGTLATFDYRYVPRGGPLGRLAAPLIDKMLTGTFTDMLAATDEAARADGSER